MKALIAALLLTAPAPSRDTILRERHRAIANRKEKAMAESLKKPSLAPAQRAQPGKRHAAPGATESLQIPVTGKGIDSKGNIYTVAGVVTLQIESAPPVPPPVVTKITGIRDPVSAGLVTGGTPGQRLVLEGELLSGPDLIRVAIGGQIAPVSRQSPTAVEFTVPPLPAGQTNLELWWLVANNWQSKGRLPFTVKGTEPLPPPPPGPTLSGIVQEPARNAVTTGSVGKSYVALGSDLPTGGEGPGTWLKLTIAGQPVILTAASSRGIAFSIPNTLTGLPLSGPVVLWRLRPGEAAWQPLATGPVFGITEGAAGPAPGPRVVP